MSPYRERRIQIDQVYSLRIKPPQDMEVISFKNGSVFYIHLKQLRPRCGCPQTRDAQQFLQAVQIETSSAQTASRSQ